MRVLLLVLGFLLLTAGPAHAHAGGLTPQDELSSVTEVDPPLPGVTARMVNHGTQLEIRNDGPVPLAVADRVVRPGEVLRYRDDRTRAATWEVPLGTSAVRGRVESTPGPNPLWWLLATALLAVGGYFLKHATGLLAGGVVVVAAAHVLHAIGSTLAVTGESFVPLMAGASGVGLVAWPLAVLAVVAAVRRSPATAFIAAVVGAMLVVAGIPDFDSFRFSQLPFAGPADADRWLVALTLGGGLGLAAGGFAFMRKDLAR
ncbi:hypothetical protein ABZ816_14540 [Actinosynnema sp. NPDC047251]|uniref:Secreted protein n=1 Tax=Saccharothrix espanaensis (strain ATCC 51144 / DSM 44229 / JCM 9112 / NBRC 15066 / NRRL 15764) TaxID=1179773 RepID=K0JZN4_SACES|nr:hypothetical protein [Saccharothrix espanaensis]CCH29758.1 hypothetical protein BN6_24440 [Saccharothrix espanaensis DSM 44229]